MLYNALTMYYLHCLSEHIDTVILVSNYYDKDKYIDDVKYCRTWELEHIYLEEFNDLFDGNVNQLLKLPGIKEVRVLKDQDTIKIDLT